ncbi:MAG: hypothetical protein A2X59_06760 [Nitrospirae bacterium GWC2_42_7]|nr:MAG: hypothetical protein A2X59_06760 [Nitrospirae bacterium GWC2_42_7]
MDLLRAYNKNSRKHVVGSRQEEDGQGKKSRLLPTTYYILSAEKGIALAMVLIISAISLSIMAALIYMLTAGTQISGMQKRYRTALEAGVGGADVTYQIITARGDPLIPLDNFSLSASSVGGYDCLADKLNNATSVWSGLCNSSLIIDPADPTTYDMTFTAGTGAMTYRIFSKIVDTVEGNSGGDFGLTKDAVVATGQGEITPMSIPYLYTIEIDAQNDANSAERAKYSVLYQF